LEIEAEKFAIPNEKELFLKAYPEFQKWVESGGAEATNWFEYPDPIYTHY
jgi:LruC domain-containing protein